MHAQFAGFGHVTIDGVRYDEDVVVANGTIRQREKAESRKLKATYGHTPLSEREPIPWSCKTLIIGTGAHGRLPITDAVHAAAREHDVHLVAAPTEEACRLLSAADVSTTNAILHLTC